MVCQLYPKMMCNCKINVLLLLNYKLLLYLIFRISNLVRNDFKTSFY